MIERPRVPCARKCVHPRQHLDDCDAPDTCPGCTPREARYGLLCHPCHTRLAGWLRDAPGQHVMLGTVAEPVLSQELSAFTHGVEVDAPAPLNVDALTTQLTLTDVLSAFVELVCDTHGMHGPARLVTGAARFDPRPWPRWSYFVGDVVWTYPPPVFEVHAACQWLTAQLDRLECCPGIGDLWGELGEVMGVAHALQPWHEQVAHVPGVPCPCCHRMTLNHHGGSADVTCEHCNEVIPAGRYLIWSRMLEEERMKAGAG